MTKQNIDLLTFESVSKRISLSRSTIYKRINEKTFPRPITLGPNCVRWRSDEIAAWIDEQVSREEDVQANAERAKKVYSARKKKPIAPVIANLEKQRDELLSALEQFVTWGRVQHKAQSKGCHATFDMLALRDEIELAEAAIASVKGTS